MYRHILLRYFNRQNVNSTKDFRRKIRQWGLRHDFTTNASSRSVAQLNFNDAELATQSKSLREILTSLAILKTCQYGVFVDNSEKLLNWFKKTLGKHSYEKIIKGTIYKQFVCGEHESDIKKVAKHLKEFSVNCMYCIPTEEISDNPYMDDQTVIEDEYDRNIKLMLGCIGLTASNGVFSQTKLTPIINTGITEQVSALMEDYVLDHNSRPTNLRVETWAEALGKDQENLVSELSPRSNTHITKALRRLDILAKAAQEQDVKVMLDAEYTNIQPCTDTIILAMQQKYNKEKAFIYNTYQCYRKDTVARIENDMDLARKHDFKLACKLVRGAYMDYERQRALEFHYQDPICDTYEDTGENYKKASDLMLSIVSEGKGEVMLATHNEGCILYGIKRMKELGIGPDSGVCFGQLYGMADYISYALGNAGYHVHKSVPYGSVDQSILYLLRRAQENKTMLMRNSKERELLLKEIKRRIARQ